MCAHHPHCLRLVFCIYLTAHLVLLQTHTHQRSAQAMPVHSEWCLCVWSRPVVALFISTEKAIWVEARQSASGSVYLW